VPDKVLRILGDDELRNLLVLNEVEKLSDNHRRILVFGVTEQIDPGVQAA